MEKYRVSSTWGKRGPGTRKKSLKGRSQTANKYRWHKSIEPNLNTNEEGSNPNEYDNSKNTIDEPTTNSDQDFSRNEEDSYAYSDNNLSPPMGNEDLATGSYESAPTARETSSNGDSSSNTSTTSDTNKNSPEDDSSETTSTVSDDADSRETQNTQRSNIMTNENVGTSGKKISAFQLSQQSSGLSNPDEQFIMVQRGALVNLFENVSCSHCNTKGLQIHIEETHGFAVKLAVKCDVCDETMGRTYSSQRLESTFFNRPPFEINQRMVDVFVACGNGHAAMQKFGAIANTNVMSGRVYRVHLEQLSRESTEMKKEVLQKARQIVREVHERIDPALKSKEVIDLCVSFDGTWQTRGFSSAHGVGAVIEVITGLVVDFETLSKYCHMCAITAAELGEDSAEFAFWQKDHRELNECNTNYEGSSGGMEVAAAQRMWKRSVDEWGVRYTKMVADGDAKVFAKLREDCPYGEDTPVEKEECINHVAKRPGTGARNVVKDTKKSGVNLGGRGEGKHTENTIIALTNFYRTSIAKNAGDIEAMRKAILATLDHCSSTDAKPNHDKCPTGSNSWCFFNKRQALGLPPGRHDQMPIKLSPAVVKALTPLYLRLSSDELLKRCTEGTTQNANESLHSVIWSKCPKTTFISIKKIDIATVTAVAEFNMGCEQTHKFRCRLRKQTASSRSKKLLSDQDRRRVRNSQEQKDNPSKKFHRKRAKRQRAANARKKTGSEHLYGAGEF